MTRRCLVYVYGPQNVIPAICAVRWYGFKKCNNEDEEVLVILHNPGISDEMAFEFKEIVINLISAQKWPEPHIILNSDINSILQHRFSRYRSSIKRFKKLIGGKTFDEIYYPHDLVGQAVELSISAYPDAKHIIFGDGMGQLYSKKYLEFIDQQLEYVNLIARVKEKTINLVKGKPKSTIPDSAVAILPMDWSGQFLNNTELQVVPLNYVRKIITDCAKNVPGIQRYIKSLLETTCEPRFLILLTNLSESGLISVESEVALNLEIIYNTIPKKSSIIIKHHPLARNSLEKTLKSLLSVEFDVQIIAQEYYRYPIEIWSDLIINSNIISTASSCVSISYLFDKSVIYPITEEFIRKFFPEKSWKIMDDTHEQYESQLNNLATWNGNSILWSGQNK